MPRISILLPFKNASSFLDETLMSIRCQSDEDWELLAVDDASADDSVSIVSRHGQEDQRIRLFKNPGTGILPALQKSLDEAKGMYVTRMDADDLMPVDRLKMMKQALDQNLPKTIITGQVRYFSDQPVSPGYLTYESWLNEVNTHGKQWQNIYRECVVASPNWMMSADDLRSTGGFSNLQYPEDYHLVFKWYEHDFHIHTLPAVTLFWREHPGRLSRNSPDYHQQAFFSLKIREFIRLDLGEGPLVIWGNRNQKTRLTNRLLKLLGIPYLYLDMDNHHRIEGMGRIKLLIAVYPDKNQREHMEKYLSDLELKEGQHWWYL